MECKFVENVIACARDSTGTISYDPNLGAALAFDDTIPWVSADRRIYRLADNALVFEDDPRVLGDAKQRKLSELGAAFDERVAGSFETSQGYLMQFDTSDAIKMEGAIKLLETTGATEGYVTQSDDTTVYNVPLDTMKVVLIEMMTAFAACHARKQELRVAINAAQTKEALESIEITWPV